MIKNTVEVLEENPSHWLTTSCWGKMMLRWNGLRTLSAHAQISTSHSVKVTQIRLMPSSIESSNIRSLFEQKREALEPTIFSIMMMTSN